MSNEETEFGIEIPALNHQWRIKFNNSDNLFNILSNQIISLKIEQKDINTVECECIFESDNDLEVNSVLYDISLGKVQLDNAILTLASALYPTELQTELPCIHNRPIQLTDIYAIETSPLSMYLDYSQGKQINISLKFKAIVRW